MNKRQQFTCAQIKRFIHAARTADPNAVVEIVTAAGTVRILPEGNRAPEQESPFDKWKARQHES